MACFRNCRFNLCPFVPLVKRRYRDKVRPSLQCCTQRGFVVFAIDAVSSVLKVPRSNAGVDISRTHTGNEDQVVVFAESFNRSPVALSGAVGEPVGGEVCVDTIKPRGQDVHLVLLIDQQCYENGVVRSIPDAAALCVLQQLSPLLRVQQIRVVYVKKWKKFASVCPVLEKRWVLSISEEKR